MPGGAWSMRRRAGVDRTGAPGSSWMCPMNVLQRWTNRKTAREIELMRTVCRLAAETLCAVDEILAPGITTLDIDRFVHEDTIRRGCIPAPLGYRGFPKSVCTSVNEVVCHGIPDGRVLADGDIIN